MKKKVFRFLVIIWLCLMTIAVVTNKSRINWLEAQQDNVIDILLFKK